MTIYPSKKRYDKKTLVKASVAFNRNIEPELCLWFEKKENKAGYLKELVRADFEKQHK